MKVPKSALLFKNGDEGSVEVLAEGEERCRFRLVGNSGKPFESGFFGKMIIDMENLGLRSNPLPVLREHDTLLVAGTGKRVEGETALVFEGEFSETTETAEEIKNLIQKDKIKFESSIRVVPKAIDYIDKGSSAEINGQTVKGPLQVLRNNEVSEVSFVLFGRDPNTSGKIVASDNEGYIELNVTNIGKDKDMSEDKSTQQVTDQQLNDAATNERNRIMAINAELPGDALSEVRTKAIAEGKTVDEAKSMAFSVLQTAKNTELDQLKAENQSQKERLAAVADGAQDLSAQGGDTEENTDDTNDGENKYLAEFNRLMDAGKTGGEAVKLAAKRYPDAHATWVKDQPYVE